MKEGCVYFAETSGGEYVKIGFSSSPTRRMAQLKTLPPKVFDIRLLGWIPGTLRTEREMHLKFQQFRDGGEWFRFTDEIREFMATLELVKDTPRPPQDCHPKRVPLIGPKRRRGRPTGATGPLNRCYWCMQRMAVTELCRHYSHCEKKPRIKRPAA